jgi:hypothetical protein
LRNLTANGLGRESDAQELVGFVEVRCRSFSLLKSFKKCSHLIHNCSLFALPAGLRLETGTKIDKKKTELYFSSREKNFLTEKRNARVPGNDKTDAHGARRTRKLLTHSPQISCRPRFAGYLGLLSGG